MNLEIEKKALELVFRTLLTCGCPVTDEEESEIYNTIQSMKPDETIKFHSILNIFQPEANSVFQRLGDFVTWQAPTNVDKFVINREHVVRHYSSSYHWNNVAAAVIDDAYKKVCSISSWFVAHMLLPVRIIEVKGETASAVYEYNNGQIKLLNLFAPGLYNPKVDQIWAVHFAGLLCSLDDSEKAAATLMLESNSMLKKFRNEVEKIDYEYFERYGDYMSFCKERHEKYYN